jgi:diguanylate cyclase (GGDEF)-like protein/PAS domain S-box-containing protein
MSQHAGSGASPAAKNPSQLAACADLFDRLRDCIMLVDPATQIVIEANNACEDVLRTPLESIVGQSVLDWVDEAGREEFDKDLRVAMRRYYPRLFECRWRHPDGHTLHMEILACPLELSDGTSVLQVLARDVSDRKEAELKLQALLGELQAANAKLEVLSTVDEMTGLFNFRYFKSELQKEHMRATRFSQPYVIVFCDIDHFKNYNDRNGHPAGDRLLREFATVLKATCRNTDVVARYGGEEFAVICPGIDAKGGAIAAERIRKAVSSRKFEFGEHQPLGHLSCSVGVATFPDHATGPDEVLKAADEAVYEAKTGGRDRICVYRPKRAGESSVA